MSIHIDNQVACSCTLCIHQSNLHLSWYRLGIQVNKP